MSARVLFSGGVQIDYQQFYIAPPGVFLDMTDAFRGQVNGICGAAQPGCLWLTTGLHVGMVHLNVTLHDSEPSLDDVWEEVVECSFESLSSRLLLQEWGSEDGKDLRVPRGAYRVRYCAQAMLGDWQMEEGNPMTQRYSLQFWQAPAGPDAIIKATGECARQWHTQMGTGK